MILVLSRKGKNSIVAQKHFDPLYPQLHFPGPNHALSSSLSARAYSHTRALVIESVFAPLCFRVSDR